MPSPEARAEIERLFAAQAADAMRHPEGKPLELERREWEAAGRLAILPPGARFQGIEADGVRCEWMEMPRVARDRVFLYLHGGGYYAGSPRTHRTFTAIVSRNAHMRLLVPDYSLAPEHPFPAAVKDGLLAYGWLLKQGIAEENIVIGGDSAGGGVALSMLLTLRSGKMKMPRCAVLLSPWIDLTASSASFERNRRRDPIVAKDQLLQAGRWYAGARDPADPLVSPFFADPQGLPPLLIHVGGDEVLLDDSRMFADVAKSAGVDVTLSVFPEMWHVFHTAAGNVPEAALAMNEVGAFIRTQFGD